MPSVSSRPPPSSRTVLFVKYVASFVIAAALAICALNAQSRTSGWREVCCQPAPSAAGEPGN